MSMLEKHKHKHPTHDFDGITENRAQKPPAYFAVLFYGLIIWGVIFMAYYLLSGWSSEGQFKERMAAHQQQLADQKPPQSAAVPAAGAQPQAEEEAVDGASLYAENCAMCHGAEGKGGIGPDLTVASYKYGREETEVLHSISAGRPGGMPGFGNRLSAAQIKGLAEYVLSLK